MRHELSHFRFYTTALIPFRYPDRNCSVSRKHSRDASPILEICFLDSKVLTQKAQVALQSPRKKREISRFSIFPVRKQFLGEKQVPDPVMGRIKNRIQKRPKPKLSDYICTDKNIVNNIILYKGYIMTIKHTRLEPGEKIDENKRYVPFEDMHLLKNVVRLTKEQLRPQEKEPVKVEGNKSSKENQGRQHKGHEGRKKSHDDDNNAAVIRDHLKQVSVKTAPLSDETKKSENECNTRVLRSTARKRMQSTTEIKKLDAEAPPASKESKEVGGSEKHDKSSPVASSEPALNSDEIEANPEVSNISPAEETEKKEDTQGSSRCSPIQAPQKNVDGHKTSENQTNKRRLRPRPRKRLEPRRIIGKHRVTSGVICYLVLWKGLPRYCATWKLGSQLPSEMIEKFEKTIRRKDDTDQNVSGGQKAKRGRPKKTEVRAFTSKVSVRRSTRINNQNVRTNPNRRHRK